MTSGLIAWVFELTPAAVKRKKDAPHAVYRWAAVRETLTGPRSGVFCRRYCRKMINARVRVDGLKAALRTTSGGWESAGRRIRCDNSATDSIASLQGKS